jgi:hypothetical protein
VEFGSPVPDNVGNLYPTDILVNFTKGESYLVPKQAPYDVSRMDFFRDLNKYATPGHQLAPLTVEQILADPAVLNRYDSIVAADSFMPGYASSGASKYTAAQYAAYANAFRAFVQKGGNLVLTDGAMASLAAIDSRFAVKDVTKGYFYAGWADFDDGSGPTYVKQELAKGVNKEGTAEGSASYGSQTFTHRHQTYEPVPIGYFVDAGGDCFSTICDSPNWIVNEAAWRKAGGAVTARTFVRLNPDGNKPGSKTGVSIGEVALGKGKIRVAGSLLPQPTEQNYHPYGLSSYSVTYTGYQVFENMTGYINPARVAVGGVKIVRPGPKPKQMPATGTGETYLAGVAALLLAGLLGRTLRVRRRRTA